MKSVYDLAVERASEALPSDSREISVTCVPAGALHMAGIRMKHTRRENSPDAVSTSKLTWTRRTQMRGNQSCEVPWESL
jgi:hypothetical protein